MTRGSYHYAFGEKFYSGDRALEKILEMLFSLGALSGHV